MSSRLCIALLVAMTAFAQQPVAPKVPASAAQPRLSPTARRARDQYAKVLKAFDPQKGVLPLRTALLDVIEIDPQFADPFRTLAAIDEQLENYATAADWLARAVAAETDSAVVESTKTRIELLRKAGDEKGDGPARRQVRFDRTLDAARHYYRDGRMAEAIQASAAASHLAPERWEPYAITAACMAETGEDDAYRLFRAKAGASAKGPDQDRLTAFFQRADDALAGRKQSTAEPTPASPAPIAVPASPVSQAAKAPSAPSTGTVIVRSTTPGLAVVVDGGDRTEKTPAMLALSAGKHSVGIRVEGQTGLKDVVVVAGEILTVNFTVGEK